MIPFRVRYEATRHDGESSVVLSAQNPAEARALFKSRYPELRIRKIKIDRKAP